MGMGSHRGLSLSIFCPLGLPFEPFDRSTGRDIAMKEGGAVGLGCRRLGRSIPCGKWLVVWTNGRRSCRFGQGDGPRGCIASVLIWSSNKLVNLAKRSFISRMSCPNSSWMFSMALIRTFHRSPVFLNLLEINLALSISLDVLYDACMHDMRNMKWHVMLKNA